MENTSQQIYKDPWDVPGSSNQQERGFYVCVSGNSGAGKSTLVKLIATKLFFKSERTIAIDEKSLHHPFISELFHDAGSYSFLIQLNFMLQRVVLVKRWLDSGYNVVMERSHIEDIIFIEHLRDRGYVTQEEYKAYQGLWTCLDKRLPHPDVMLFLDVSAETSLQRLHEDESSGRRPREFPNDAMKESWIRSWHRLYSERLAELKENTPAPLKLLIFTETSNMTDIATRVLSELGV